MVTDLLPNKSYLSTVEGHLRTSVPMRVNGMHPKVRRETYSNVALPIQALRFALSFFKHLPRANPRTYSGDGESRLYLNVN